MSQFSQSSNYGIYTSCNGNGAGGLGIKFLQTKNLGVKAPLPPLPIAKNASVFRDMNLQWPVFQHTA